MIKVQIDECDLLDLLIQRLEYWTEDTRVLSLYEQYLSDLIDGGCFEGARLEIQVFIDNLYVNDTQIMNKEELDNNGIDDCEKILAKDIDDDLYLVSNY